MKNAHHHHTLPPSLPTSLLLLRLLQWMNATVRSVLFDSILCWFLFEIFWVLVLVLFFVWFCILF
jgi:hypothetical protein